MTKIATIVLFVFVQVLTNKYVESSVCKKINDVHNGFPLGLEEKDVPKVDYLGRISSDFYKIFGSLAKKEKKSRKCQTQLAFIGKFAVRFSPVPIGCCSVCCIIDKIEDHVELYFTNKELKGRTKRVSLSLKAGKLKKVGFNKESPTIIYTHGFTEHKLGFTGCLITDAYLSRNETYNILILGWSDLSPIPWYNTAVENTKLAGKAAAEFIKFYDSTGEMPIEKIHLIGLSLGAHVSGYIGKYLSKTKKIPRITGLDPAFPLFPPNDVNKRLSKYDAEYVDVIHTDMGKLGYPVSIGHTDFYPNYGQANQPPCIHQLDFILKQHTEEFLVCDHMHAAELYADSVRRPHSFPAMKMKAMNVSLTRKARLFENAYMGFSASKSAIGDYYLVTNANTPFGKSVEEQDDDMKLYQKRR